MNFKTLSALLACLGVFPAVASAYYDCRTTLAHLRGQNGGEIPSRIAPETAGVDASNLAGMIACVCEAAPSHAQCRPSESAKPAPEAQPLGCREGLNEYRAREERIETLVKNPSKAKGGTDPSTPPGGWTAPMPSLSAWYEDRKDSIFRVETACARLGELRRDGVLIQSVLKACGEAQEKRQVKRGSLLPSDKEYHGWLTLKGYLMNNAVRVRRSEENLSAILDKDGLRCE